MLYLPKHHSTCAIWNWYPAHICLAENYYSKIFCLSNSVKLKFFFIGPCSFPGHGAVPMWAALGNCVALINLYLFLWIYFVFMYLQIWLLIYLLSDFDYFIDNLIIFSSYMPNICVFHRFFQTPNLRCCVHFVLISHHDVLQLSFFSFLSHIPCFIFYI